MHVHSICCLFFLVNKFYSAKEEPDSVIPQSSKVLVYQNGTCHWSPLVIWSVSHCPMDSTWFPFDDQQCDFIYESWKYRIYDVNLTSYFGSDADKAIQEYDLQPNDLWEFLGRLRLFYIPGKI